MMISHDDGAIILDPAASYGDRETDLAMTALFGGFPRAFYEAYSTEWPLPPGATARRPLYTLYHLLNHATVAMTPRRQRQSPRYCAESQDNWSRAREREA